MLQRLTKMFTYMIIRIFDILRNLLFIIIQIAYFIFIRTLKICLKVIFLVVTKHVFKIAKFCYAQHTYILKLKLFL